MQNPRDIFNLNSGPVDPARLGAMLEFLTPGNIPDVADGGILRLDRMHNYVVAESLDEGTKDVYLPEPTIVGQTVTVLRRGGETIRVRVVGDQIISADGDEFAEIDSAGHYVSLVTMRRSTDADTADGDVSYRWLVTYLSSDVNLDD